jgi:hypothetical protein
LLLPSAREDFASLHLISLTNVSREFWVVARCAYNAYYLRFRSVFESARLCFAASDSLILDLPFGWSCPLDSYLPGIANAILFSLWEIYLSKACLRICDFRLAYSIPYFQTWSDSRKI